MSKTQSKATLEINQTFKVKEFVEAILLFSISAGMSWYLDMIQLTTTPIMVGIGLIVAGISIGYSTLETVLIAWTVLTLVSVILIASIAIFVPLTALKISAISMISLLVGGTSGSVMFWLIQRRLFLSLGRTKGIVVASLMIALGLLLSF
ncbi:putative membrane protein [Lyngbya aestuarii BL J]|uniref:Putative membrane protein n=1 Tax=Lyngbya aestuarii BL J TaxID=1348334 RepID=U7QD00_9CYAN|nr:hypothetical protein [Lyngbya aestuarii]ERT04875.1 putative membrane protein [Lyngbya aestuarii BL J]